MRSDFGRAANIGGGIELARRRLVNLDAKKLWLDPHVLTARADLGPWIGRASIRYRF